MDHSLRLFYALWPDEATRQALAGWQKNLSGRKTPSQNLHITLAFLGEQPREALDELAGIVETLSFDAILLTLDKTGYFAHNRISWAGMQQVPDALLQMQRELVLALKKRRIAFDGRNRFTPHLTLARHSDRPRGSAPAPVLWHARHLALVESLAGKEAHRPGQQYIIRAGKMAASEK